MENLIIHISGASGSGKTTLGNKLKEHFKSKIIVKDLDELLDEHFIDYFGKKSLNNVIMYSKFAVIHIFYGCKNY